MQDTTGWGKIIRWEVGKKFKYNQTNKWYRHNPESVLEKETHKQLLGYEI